jgi:hypothetical protein
VHTAEVRGVGGQWSTFPPPCSGTIEELDTVFIGGLEYRELYISDISYTTIISIYSFISIIPITEYFYL